MKGGILKCFSDLRFCNIRLKIWHAQMLGTSARAKVLC